MRVVVCLGLWMLAYRIFVSGSIRQDGEKDPGFNVRARRFAPVFMVIFGITITIVAFDWISSLEPAWYSDVFGVYIFAGTFLAGLAATTLAVLYLMARGRLPGVGPDHVYNLGGFLFAFIVFWSYIGFAQYLLMWYANLPEEVFWYKERLAGTLGSPGARARRSPLPRAVPGSDPARREERTEAALSGSRAVMLVAHWLDLYWMIFPGPRQRAALQLARTVVRGVLRFREPSLDPARHDPRRRHARR